MKGINLKLLVFLFSIPSLSFGAACSNDSELQYTSSEVQTCVNDVWTSAKGASLGSCAGTTASTVRYASNTVQFCDGSNWYDMKGTSVGSCAGTTASTMRSSGGVAQFCDGTNWYNIGGGNACGAGFSYNGYCYYMWAGRGDSCYSVCHSRASSSCKLEGIQAINTTSYCQSVFDGLSAVGGAVTSTTSSSGSSCYYHIASSTRYFDTNAATCHAEGAGTRACACADSCPGGGRKVNGVCWWYGSEGESCDTVCASHGGYSAQTQTFAGSGGNDSNCRMLLDSLGALGVTVNIVNPCAEGWGCGYKTGTGRMWCQGPATTSSDAGDDVRRACACLVAPI